MSLTNDINMLENFFKCEYSVSFTQTSEVKFDLKNKNKEPM